MSAYVYRSMLMVEKSATISGKWCHGDQRADVEPKSGPSVSGKTGRRGSERAGRKAPHGHSMEFRSRQRSFSHFNSRFPRGLLGNLRCEDGWIWHWEEFSSREHLFFPHLSSLHGRVSAQAEHGHGRLMQQRRSRVCHACHCKRPPHLLQGKKKSYIWVITFFPPKIHAKEISTEFWAWQSPLRAWAVHITNIICTRHRKGSTRN